MPDVESLDDLINGVTEIDTAHDGYSEADRYYAGRIDEVFASPRIRAELEATGERYRFNLAKTAVNALANRVAITGITTGDQAADKAIAAIREANRMELLEPELHRSVFKFGDSYLFSALVYRAADGGERTDEIIGVRAIHNSPFGVRAIYHPDDNNTPLYVVKSWLEGGRGKQLRRADLYYPDGDKNCVIARYITRANTSGRDPADWDQYLDEDQDLTDWLIDYGYGLPWFHFRNGTPYGHPEHADAYGPQDAVNKMLVSQLTTTDKHCHEERYGLLDDNAVLDQAHDAPNWPDDLDADETQALHGGQDSAERTGAGTMTKYTGMKSVGQWPAADPKVFLEPADLYVRLMSQVTDTPLHDFDPSREQPSGESRRRADKPLVDKAENRKLYLKSTWSPFWTYSLGLMGITAPAVDVRWSPSAQITDAEGWQVLEIKRRMGVPVEQLLIEAGYSPEQSAEWAKNAPPPDATSGPALPGTQQSASTQESGLQADLDWGLFGAGAKG